MLKRKFSFANVVLVAFVFVALSLAHGAGPEVLTGAVKDAAGAPMEGVTVSARAAGQTFTTSVYTDQSGRYSFSGLADGQYQLWAQAVGFDAAKGEQRLSAARKAQQDFALKPLQDVSKQLSGDEWMASLPGETPHDRRMQAIFVNDCTNCHPASFTFQNSFDKRGWEAIVNFMSKSDPWGLVRNPDRMNPYMQAYKDELVEYMTRVRGPNSPAIQYKTVPRPKGEATRVVVTEFDLSPGDRPGYILPHNGAIWSEGTPSRHDGNAAHDVAVDSQGMVWFSDQINPERTIGKLDPRTGKVTGYKLAGKDGTSVGTHGIAADPSGHIWFTNTEEGSLTKFDPKTEQFTRFPRPDGVSAVGSTMIDVDSKGNIWAVSVAGSVRLDPKTGRYTDYKTVTPGGGPYGIAVDSKDNAWVTQLTGGRLSVVDSTAGEVGEIVLKNEGDAESTSKDQEVATRMKALVKRPDLTGPRRLGADKKGNTVWVAEFFGDKLAKIDIASKTVKEYSLPHRYVLPYSAVVDKNHMVWIALMNSDRVAKFDPAREQFTEYHLPTRGTEPRHITVDNTTSQPTIWIPYYRSNKLARIELRAASEVSRASAER